MSDFQVNDRPDHLNMKFWKDMNRFQKVFWIYSSVLFIQSVLPINDSGSMINTTFILNYRLDYLVHAGLFTLWMILYKLAYFQRTGSFGMKTLVYAGSAIVIAVVSETIQMVVPYRAYNIMDMKANVYGVIIGFLMITVYRLIK